MSTYSSPIPAEALVEAREQVLAGAAALAVRAGPHVVARLRRDDELVAERAQVVTQEPAERLLRRPVRRPVVVREVEVRNSEIAGSSSPLRPVRRYAMRS